MTGSWIVRLSVVFHKQENSKVHKRSIISIPNTIKFDRQVNSTGYKSMTCIFSKDTLFDRQVNSTGYKRSKTEVEITRK